VRSLLPLCLLLAAGCSRSDRVSTAPSAALSPPRAVTEGQAFALHLEPGSVKFCDNRGRRLLDLATGQQSALQEPCSPAAEANTACSGLTLDVTVRAPLAEPNDIVDVNGASFPLNGKVHDCAATGKWMAIATGSRVVLIDVSGGKIRELSPQGGDRVTIGSGWVVWSDDTSLLTARIPTE
jgi:hypothetical protein